MGYHPKRLYISRTGVVVTMDEETYRRYYDRFFPVPIVAGPERLDKEGKVEYNERE